MKIPFLQGDIRIFTYDIPIYKIFQHGSTLFGLVIILLYLYTNRCRSNRNYVKINGIEKTKYWSSIIIMTSVILGLRIAYFNYNISMNYIGIYVVTLISGFIISTITISLLFRKKIN